MLVPFPLIIPLNIKSLLLQKDLRMSDWLTQNKQTVGNEDTS